MGLTKKYEKRRLCFDSLIFSIPQVYKFYFSFQNSFIVKSSVNFCCPAQKIRLSLAHNFANKSRLVHVNKTAPA